MLKVLAVVLMLAVCCYCEETTAKTEVLTEETRAKKKKTLKFLAMIALFILSKVAIFKVASFFFFVAFFQKLFSIGGVLLTYFMKAQLNMPMPSPAPAAPSVAPASSYGPPEYNTLGYSYGPPEHEAAFAGPSIADFGTPLSWILKP